MKTLLFYPPMTIRGEDTTQPGLVFPIGVSHIASYIQSKGFDVSIIDALAEGFDTQKKTKKGIRFGLSKKDIIKKLKYFKPDIVGISIMFTAFASDAHNLAAIVKKFNKKIVVVFGGVHASVSPYQVLKDKNIDIVVIGEGEITFEKILNKIKKKKKLTKILGTAIRLNNKIIINKPRPFIKDLDSLPFPATHLLPMDLYLKSQPLYDMRHPTASMFTSRGCPNNCIYCAVPRMWGRTWRPFSAKRVVNEIEYLINRYGFKEFHFLDDNISVDKKRLNDICDLIIKRKINIKWNCPNGIAIWTLDEKILKKMKKSGCYRLTFGIESGSVETQKFIRKNLNLKKAKEIMKIASKLGYWTFSTYIIGFPYETIADVNKTLEFAIKSNNDFIAIILLMPFPGTDVTKLMLQKKLLTKNDLSKTKIGALFSGYKGKGNVYFTPQELKYLQDKAHKRLLFSRLFWPITRPISLLHKINNFEDFKYFLKILHNFLIMFIYTIKLGSFKTHRIKQALDLKIIKNESK